MTVKSGSTKRRSLLNRHNRTKSSASEKSVGASGADANGGHGPFSIGDNNDDNHDDNDPESEDEDNADDNTRSLYFNVPLPDELLDEDGHPVINYHRNKIRTAKYTPLSFIPKNFWFQFHNVANIFFLFVIILVVSTTPSNVTPLIMLPALCLPRHRYFPYLEV